MNWIRIAVGIQDDPKLAALAERLNVKLPHAVGLTVCVLVQFPDHALDGDIRTIPATTLERWAGWTGKAGHFDSAFRTVFCTGGVVSSWLKHNGTPIRRAIKNADDKRAERERRRAVSADGGDDGAPDGGSNETNETNETNENSSSTPSQKARAPFVLHQTPRGAA
jgi:hypothetical protein